MGIAVEFGQILSDLANLSTLISNIFNTGAKQDTAQSTLANTQVLIVGMASMQGTLALMKSQLSEIQSNEATLQSNLLFAIGRPQQADVAVLLPASPPSGYGGASASAAATAVWQYVPADVVSETQGMLKRAYTGVFRIGEFGWLHSPHNKFLAYTGDISDPAEFPDANPPIIDPGTILPSDAGIFAWITRVYVGPPWTDWTGVGDGAEYIAIGGIANRVNMTPGEFLFWQAFNAGALPTAASGAPVWPGLANVTLGSPVPIVPTEQTIPGPMHGVLVDLTTIPQPLPFYDLSAAQGWAKLGQLTFVDDNGDAEPQQMLSFVHGLFMPKGMKEASSCGIKTLSGLGGTITPFTIP